MRLSSSLTSKLIPAVVLAVIVLFGLAVYADAPALLDALMGFDLRVLPLAIAFASLNFVVRFVRWHYFLRHLDIEVAPRLSAGVFLTGLSMSITPGKIGELVKCFMLRDRLGVRIASSAPVVVAERYTDIVGILVLLALGSTRFEGAGFIILAGGAVVVFGLILATFSEGLVDRGGALLSRTLFSGKGLEADWARESASGFRRLLKGQPLVVGTTLGALAWFAECVAFLLVLRGFGNDAIGLLGATFVYAASTLAGALSMLPGGLGATEGTMTAFLVSQGASPGLAAGATLVTRACTLWWGVMVGIATYLALSTWARTALREAEGEGA